MINQLSLLIATILLYSFIAATIVWFFTAILTSIQKKSIINRKIRFIGILAFVVIMVNILTSLSINDANTTEVTSTQNLFLNQQNNFFYVINNGFNYILNYSETLCLLWFVGFLLNGYGFLNGYKKITRLKKSSTDCNHDKLLEVLQKIKLRMKIKRDIKLLFSPLINSPITTGFIKPIIYLPIGFVNNLTFYEVESILQHEISHIKRFDYLINILLVSLESIFFFNPILLILIKELRTEMEFVCDDDVTKNYHSITYAYSLLKLQENNIISKIVLPIKKAETSEFRHRIERIVSSNSTRKKTIFQITLPILLIVIMGLSIGMNRKEKTPVLKAKEKSATIINTNNTASNKPINKKEDLILPNKAQIVSITPPPEPFLKKIHSELIKDGILNEKNQKVVLMFQRSDIIKGEKVLGKKYPKYKKMFTNYFPRYDSYAFTKTFTLNKSNFKKEIHKILKVNI